MVPSEDCQECSTVQIYDMQWEWSCVLYKLARKTPTFFAMNIIHKSALEFFFPQGNCLPINGGKNAPALMITKNWLDFWSCKFELKYYFEILFNSSF